MENEYNLALNVSTFGGQHFGFFTIPCKNVLTLKKDSPNYEEQIDMLKKLIGSTAAIVQKDGAIVADGLWLTKVICTSNEFSIHLDKDER